MGGTGRKCQSKKKAISEQEGSGHGWAGKEVEGKLCARVSPQCSEMPPKCLCCLSWAV